MNFIKSIFSLLIFTIIISYFSNIESYNWNIKKCNKDRLLVTGSSANHFHLLMLMLFNVFKFENDLCFIIWDLGLSIKQKESLHLLYSYLKQKASSVTVIYTVFNFSNYPSFFNIRINAGQYAWKPIIISTTYYTYKKPLLWLDAGCNIIGSLNNVYSDIYSVKIWTIGAGRDVKKYTHISTLLYLNASSRIWRNIMCAATVVGLYYPHSLVDTLLKDWVECSFEKECIAPKYSNRSNHRQDQSVFTILLYKLKLNCNRGSSKYNFVTHFDRHYKFYNNSEYMNYLKIIQ